MRLAPLWLLPHRTRYGAGYLEGYCIVSERKRDSGLKRIRPCRFLALLVQLPPGWGLLGGDGPTRTR
jgi:hypothetical protein